MQIQDLPKLLRSNYVFAGLPEQELEAMASRFTLEVFELGDVVIRQGESGDAFFIIYSGKARVVVEKADGKATSVALLNPGESFGEQALINSSPRTATVRAAGALTVLRLSAADFHALVDNHPDVRERIDQRIRRNTEFNFIKTLGLLSQLSIPQAEQLLSKLQRLILNDGEILFREGDPSNSCFLVRDGEIRIQKGVRGRERQIAIVKTGDVIGEISLLRGQPRSATAIAKGAVILLELTREVFDEYVDRNGANEALALQAANRLLQNETLVAEEAEKAPELPDLHLQKIKLSGKWFSPAWPFVATTDPRFSGIACLMIIDSVYGGPADFKQELDRKLKDPTPETLLSISRQAEDRDYLTRLLRLNQKRFSSAPLPAIIEEAPDEFAVLHAVSEKRAVVASPLRGLRSVARRDFDASFSGQLLSIANVPNFATPSQAATLIRQIGPFLRPFVQSLITIAVLSLLAQFLGLAQPLFTKVIIDSVLVTGDTKLLYLLLFGSLLVTTFQMASGALRQYLTAHIGRRISAAMQLRFVHHILSLTQRVSSKWQVGDFILRLQENEKLLSLISQSGSRIVIDSIMTLIYVVVLFRVNSKLATASLPFIAATTALLFIGSPLLRRLERRAFSKRQQSESQLIEVIGGIQTVKSLAIEKPTFERGAKLVHEVKSAEFEFANLSATLGLISELLNQASVIVIFGFGAQQVLKGDLSAGELVAFQALFAAAMSPLMSLVKLWDEVQETRIAFERTADVLRSETEVDPKNAVTTVIRGHVEFRNVSFRYADDGENILTGINLEVLPGQKVAIVGRSASGKTTLANLLLNHYQPTEGSIRIDQVELNNMHKAGLRRQLGVVEQHPFLFSGTIRENIAKADPTAGLDRVVAAATLAGIHQFVEELPMGYDTQIGERGMTLSGGQRQRIAIARAILGNPKMLIFDEATSALDTESESIIQRNLDPVTRGRTSFVIAHRLSTVRSADLIVVIDKGRIVETGTHSTLLERRGLYYYLNAAAA